MGSPPVCQGIVDWKCDIGLCLCVACHKLLGTLVPYMQLKATQKWREE